MNLRGGKVFNLEDDGTPGSVVLSNEPNQPDYLYSEETFLQAVRSRAAKESGANLSEGRHHDPENRETAYGDPRGENRGQTGRFLMFYL
jgi:hypothetical protein